MTERTEHRWAVESITEEVARVEEDGERMIAVARALLPVGVAEGQLLRVTRAPASEGAKVLSVAVDEAGTAQVMEKPKRKTDEIMASSLKIDRGGDIAL